MKHGKTETIVRYYHQIPEMVRLLQGERADLEGQYNPLGAMNMDGMPGGSEPGKPVESLALALDNRGCWDRLQEIDVKLQVLAADAETIRGCLDSISGRYKRILTMRYEYGYNWVKISMRLGAPESSVRRWGARALQRLGEVMDDAPMVEELLGRASRARV